MEDKLISFETARLAKEKGFDIPQNKMYSYGKDMFEYIDKVKFHDGTKHQCSETPYNWNDGKSQTATKYFSAPTQSLLQKWLREVHKIHIDICYQDDVYGYYYKTTTIIDNTESDESIGFNTYEEALERGLQEGLKLIKT